MSYALGDITGSQAPLRLTPAAPPPVPTPASSVRPETPPAPDVVYEPSPPPEDGGTLTYARRPGEPPVQGGEEPADDVARAGTPAPAVADAGMFDRTIEPTQAHRPAFIATTPDMTMATELAHALQMLRTISAQSAALPGGEAAQSRTPASDVQMQAQLSAQAAYALAAHASGRSTARIG